jgi:hypothetical protein
MPEPEVTDICPYPACNWRGSWDGVICPECGENTYPIQVAREMIFGKKTDG